VRFARDRPRRRAGPDLRDVEVAALARGRSVLCAAQVFVRETVSVAPTMFASLVFRAG